MFTKEELLKLKQSLKTLSVVYFLFLGDEVVYVGQSINGTDRIAEHRKDKKFDSYVAIEVRDDLLDIVEECYIRVFTPLYNKSKNPRYGYNNSDPKYAMKKTYPDKKGIKK